MTVKNEKFTISTKGFDDLINITKKVQDLITGFNIEDGIANITVSASTASLITLESEPGLVMDLPKLLDNIVPINKIYKHDNVWYEGNAHAHLKAVLLGNNLTLPVVSGKIELNNWQQIVLIDFDNKPRIRQIIVSVTY